MDRERSRRCRCRHNAAAGHQVPTKAWSSKDGVEDDDIEAVVVEGEVEGVTDLIGGEGVEVAGVIDELR